jgi:hypothetical protein
MAGDRVTGDRASPWQVEEGGVELFLEDGAYAGRVRALARGPSRAEVHAGHEGLSRQLVRRPYSKRRLLVARFRSQPHAWS